MHIAAYMLTFFLILRVFYQITHLEPPQMCVGQMMMEWLSTLCLLFIIYSSSQTRQCVLWLFSSYKWCHHLQSNSLHYPTDVITCFSLIVECFSFRADLLLFSLYQVSFSFGLLVCISYYLSVKTPPETHNEPVSGKDIRHLRQFTLFWPHCHSHGNTLRLFWLPTCLLFQFLAGRKHTSFLQHPHHFLHFSSR